MAAVARMNVWGIRDEAGKLVGIIEPIPAGQRIYLTEQATAEDVAEIINGGVIPIISGVSENDHGRKGEE